MTTMAEVKEAKQRLYDEIAAHVVANPMEPFESVAKSFGVAQSTVSRIAARVTRSKRSPGRKPNGGLPTS